MYSAFTDTAVESVTDAEGELGLSECMVNCLLFTPHDDRSCARPRSVQVRSLEPSDVLPDGFVFVSTHVAFPPMPSFLQGVAIGPKHRDGVLVVLVECVFSHPATVFQASEIGEIFAPLEPTAQPRMDTSLRRAPTALPRIATATKR